MSDGIFLSAETLRGASPEQLSIILGLLRLSSAAGRELDDADSSGTAAILSDSQWKAMLEAPISARTVMAAEQLAKYGPRFRFSDFLDGMNVEHGEWNTLRGVWSAFTKRVRKITGQSDAILIEWYNWEEDDVTKIFGVIAPETHAALIRVLHRGR